MIVSTVFIINTLMKVSCYELYQGCLMLDYLIEFGVVLKLLFLPNQFTSIRNYSFISFFIN